MITKKKSSPSKKRSKKSSSSKTSLKKELVRDVFTTPSLKQIQASLQQGTTRTLADFRTFTGW